MGRGEAPDVLYFSHHEKNPDNTQQSRIRFFGFIFKKITSGEIVA